LDAVPVARRSLFVSMADAVVAVDERDRIVDSNEAARAVLGADERVIGKDAAAVIPTEALACEVGASVAVPLTRGGTRRRYEISVSPIRSEGVPGRPNATDERIGRLLVLRDVTEQHGRQLALAAQNERLEAFSSVLSHDLRNPLNVAQGHLELARATGADQHFDAVDRALGRISELTDDLLALARTGASMGDAEDVHLAELVGECWATVVTEGATLVVDTDQLLSADRLRLKQVFENLFRNAVEHGGATVTVTVGDLADGAGFYVADDGPGVPESDRELVFESGHSTLAGNTGLGLAIVKQAAEAHRWSVRLTASEAGGARFEFTTAA
jgi:signal transduction histidine kinase